MPSKTSVSVALLAAAAAIFGIRVGSRWSGTSANQVVQEFPIPPTKEVRPSLLMRTSTRIAEESSLNIPRFSGYVTIGSERRFAVSLPTSDATKERHEWLTIGQRIGAFEIREFDLEQEVLSLINSVGDSIELRVADPTITDATEQLTRRWKNLIDTSPRAIRDLYEPVPAPRR